MTTIHRSALVSKPAEHMFALVNDVAAYPSRFEWCAAAAVVERGDDWLIAHLEVRIGGIRAAFSTRNVLDQPRRIDLSLIEGPFQCLNGAWSFQPLSASACKVALHLDFEFAGRFLGSALALGFQRLADRMVDDFVNEARGP